MKKTLLILCLTLFLAGCADQSGDSSLPTESTTEEISTGSLADYETTSAATEASEIEKDESDQSDAQNAYVEIPEGALSQEGSAELLRQRLENYGIFEDTEDDAQHISFEGTTVINYRECYQFRVYNDFDDHRATLGFYAVNPDTGECFDTTTEPMPLYYRFEITDSGTEIYEKYAKVPFQVIDPSYSFPDYLSDHLSDPLGIITVNDLDFDGYEDIAVMVRLSASQASYEYYRYDPDTQQFERWEELNKLYFFAQPDIANETLTVYSKSGAIDHYKDVYKWNDGTLYTVEKRIQYLNSEDGEIYIDRFKCDEDGNETLVKRGRVLIDENNEWLGTEEIEIE